jgi:hypothetical protein
MQQGSQVHEKTNGIKNQAKPLERLKTCPLMGGKTQDGRQCHYHPD